MSEHNNSTCPKCGSPGRRDIYPAGAVERGSMMWQYECGSYVRDDHVHDFKSRQCCIIADLRKEREIVTLQMCEMFQALSRIAVEVRSDGTYNLGREACERVAREALAIAASIRMEHILGLGDEAMEANDEK